MRNRSAHFAPKGAKIDIVPTGAINMSLLAERKHAFTC